VVTPKKLLFSAYRALRRNLKLKEEIRKTGNFEDGTDTCLILYPLVIPPLPCPEIE